jgi:hypothetical protein
VVPPGRSSTSKASATRRRRGWVRDEKTREEAKREQGEGQSFDESLVRHIAKKFNLKEI